MEDKCINCVNSEDPEIVGDMNKDFTKAESGHCKLFKHHYPHDAISCSDFELKEIYK